MNIPIYPCDRGMANVQVRGFHNFAANPLGVICCTYCGATPKAVR